MHHSKQQRSAFELTLSPINMIDTLALLPAPNLSEVCTVTLYSERTAGLNASLMGSSVRCRLMGSLLESNHLLHGNAWVALVATSVTSRYSRCQLAPRPVLSIATCRVEGANKLLEAES